MISVVVMNIYFTVSKTELLHLTTRNFSSEVMKRWHFRNNKSEQACFRQGVQNTYYYVHAKYIPRRLFVDFIYFFAGRSADGTSHQ